MNASIDKNLEGLSLILTAKDNLRSRFMDLIRSGSIMTMRLFQNELRAVGFYDSSKVITHYKNHIHSTYKTLKESFDIELKTHCLNVAKSNLEALTNRIPELATYKSAITIVDIIEMFPEYLIRYSKFLYEMPTLKAELIRSNKELEKKIIQILNHRLKKWHSDVVNGVVKPDFRSKPYEMFMADAPIVKLPKNNKIIVENNIESKLDEIAQLNVLNIFTQAIQNIKSRNEMTFGDTKIKLSFKAVQIEAGILSTSNIQHLDRILSLVENELGVDVTAARSQLSSCSNNLKPKSSSRGLRIRCTSQSKKQSKVVEYKFSIQKLGFDIRNYGFEFNKSIPRFNLKNQDLAVYKNRNEKLKYILDKAFEKLLKDFVIDGFDEFKIDQVFIKKFISNYMSYHYGGSILNEYARQLVDNNAEYFDKLHLAKISSKANTFLDWCESNLDYFAKYGGRVTKSLIWENIGLVISSCDSDFYIAGLKEVDDRRNELNSAIHSSRLNIVFNYIDEVFKLLDKGNYDDWLVTPSVGELVQKAGLYGPLNLSKAESADINFKLNLMRDRNTLNKYKKAINNIVHNVDGVWGQSNEINIWTIRNKFGLSSAIRDEACLRELRIACVQGRCAFDLERQFAIHSALEGFLRSGRTFDSQRELVDIVSKALNINSKKFVLSTVSSSKLTPKLINCINDNIDDKLVDTLKDELFGNDLIDLSVDTLRLETIYDSVGLNSVESGVGKFPKFYDAWSNLTMEPKVNYKFSRMRNGIVSLMSSTVDYDLYSVAEVNIRLQQLTNLSYGYINTHIFYHANEINFLLNESRKNLVKYLERVIQQLGETKPAKYLTMDNVLDKAGVVTTKISISRVDARYTKLFEMLDVVNIENPNWLNFYR